MAKTNAKKKAVPVAVQEVANSNIPQIEKNVPIPAIKSNGKWELMKDMVSGDSFYLDAKDFNIASATGTIRSAASRLGFKVTIRNNTDGSGARIWRV